jgi:phosphatidylcholine synthase
MDMRTKKPRTEVILGLTTHLLTAAGVLAAFFAVLAIFQNDPVTALLWLGAALVIDGVDGPLARRLNVASTTPNIDGATLDLIVDYLNYVFAPALLLYQFDLVPDAFKVLSVALILLTGVFAFVRTDLKTADNDFVGLAGVWNVPVFVLFIVGASPWVNLGAVLLLAILNFAPIRIPHPIRVAQLRIVTIAMIVLWGIASVLILLTLPDRPVAPLALWYLSAGYFLGLIVWRTLRQPK